MTANLPPDEARVYRLPSRSADTPPDADRLARAGDIIDGDTPDDDGSPVLVDQPAPAEDRSLYDAVRQAREARRRPIVPGWARRDRNWWALARRGGGYAGYPVGYYLVGVPLDRAWPALRS